MTSERPGSGRTREASSSSVGSVKACPRAVSRLAAFKNSASSGAAKVMSRPRRQSQNHAPTQTTMTEAALENIEYRKWPVASARLTSSWEARRESLPAVSALNHPRGKVAILSPTAW